MPDEWVRQARAGLNLGPGFFRAPPADFSDSSSDDSMGEIRNGINFDTLGDSDADDESDGNHAASHSSPLPSVSSTKIIHYMEFSFLLND